MWEVILVIAAFMSGWGIKDIIERKKRTWQTEKPEMMWFNDKKSRWERITSMQLYVADRAVVKVPVKVIKQSEKYESR
jgi:hypothetical protein